MNSCGFTAAIEHAQDLMRFLRVRKRGEGAILFGTVKVYVGERNFVSNRNQPLSSISVTVKGPDGARTVRTDLDGWYAINGLSAGDYTAQISPP
jgi:hypothetical protein